MAKGRRFKPSLDKDGSWFPHIGLTQKTPESLMSSVLKEPYCLKFIQQAEEKLPPIYKVREKQAVSNNFPFSVHDNRHSLENSGCYLDSGLGRKKISPDKGQHVSRNFNLWACDFIPSCLDGFSSNQIAYVYKEAMTAPNFRRFPKSYNNVWDTFKTAEQSCVKPK
ncbi:PREDICTED: testis-expressed sequence 36 protein [Chinchilla lanigera]|uniref:Testis expressed 36 n=1 Tax=Chinchilla lanigera TaxID=34839 RepID=A0A8C2UQL4_CHILA|nr:PREDICTED: testis-expressed sequence 36 protein [Chinchilla lanigera]